MLPEAVLSVVVGIALAAACGLRIFVPLLVLSVAAHVKHFTPAAGFAWLGSDAALIALGVATVVEVAAYHVPWLDHVLDAAGAPLAIAAGVIVMAASAQHLSPFLRWALPLVAGGGAAGVFFALTSIMRLGSTLTTGGLANPLFATFEAGAAVVLSILALLLPLLASLVIVGFIWIALRRRRRRMSVRPGGNAWTAS